MSKLNEKIIFIGNIVSDKICQENKACSPAANKWQINFLENLKKVSKKEVVNISILPLKVYPFGEYIAITSFFKKNQNISRLLKYINIIGLKKISIFISIFLTLLKYSKKHTYIIYNLYTPILIAALLLKKIFKIQIIAIVADLVYVDDLNCRGVKKILHFIEVKIQEHGLKSIDKVIAVNKLIIDDFEIKNGMVLEGGVTLKNDLKTKDINKNSKKNKKIIFTGTLDNLNGIEFLLETFKNINNVELHIYGRGPLELKVINASKNNKKIKYKGFICQNKVMEILESGDLLILPRVQTIKTLRYTFPSKLFEYMLSGTPVIMTKIPGLSQGYIENTYVCDTNDVDEFAKFIQEKANLDSKELIKKGMLGRKFIQKEKTWDLQMRKVWVFLNEDNN